MFEVFLAIINEHALRALFYGARRALKISRQKNRRKMRLKGRRKYDCFIDYNYIIL